MAVERGQIVVRAATSNDLPFLQKMLYEAAHKPGTDWPPFDECINEAGNIRFWRGWMRPGDVGVIAEEDAVPVGAAWVRLFAAGDLTPIDHPAVPVLAI